MTLFQWIFGTLCALLALRHGVRIAFGNGSRLAGLFWGLLWAGAAITIFRPGITGELASLFGIGRGADLVIYLAILGGILAVRYFYNRCRRLESMITQVVRSHATENAVPPHTSHSREIVR